MFIFIKLLINPPDNSTNEQASTHECAHTQRQKEIEKQRETQRDGERQKHRKTQRDREIMLALS